MNHDHGQGGRKWCLNHLRDSRAKTREQSIQALGPASTKPGGRKVFPTRKKLARAEGGAARTVSSISHAEAEGCV